MLTLQLHPDDDVVVALCDLPERAEFGAPEQVTRAEIPSGHKIATKVIEAGQPVRKYGQIIGLARSPIVAGDHVHSHNLGMTDPTMDADSQAEVQRLPAVSKPRTFEGYHRPSGKVGTRNYLGIITTVNCSGSVARFIAEEFSRDGGLATHPNVDGVVPIVHTTGCGMTSQGEGYDTLMRTLSGYARHPNFGGVLLIGLGCEVMQISQVEDELGNASKVRRLVIQDAGGTKACVARGVEILHELATIAGTASRAAAPVSALTLGMQCGGSDGYSGITANPALGMASDLMVRHGGTSILSETPEIHGAEQLLLRRSVNDEVRRALRDRLHWWQDYSAKHGATLDNNPSPGNKLGGLTTILEKSLGAVAKSGTAPLEGFFLYGEPIDRQGLVFMDSPGYDPCSVTGQIASGANLVAFTTGRGSVSGFLPVPGLKLASSSVLFEKMRDDMDVNCGEVLEGLPLEDKGAEIFNHLLAVASGRKTKSEELGFGNVEFVPWQMGAVV